MRSTIIICLAAAAFLSGCAYEGTIVEKRFRPLPFPDSLGVDGMYKLDLRDRAAQVHAQMVTPDVFANYRVGDYFNDLQQPPARNPKDFQARPSSPADLDQMPYQPVRTTSIHGPQRAQKQATKIAVTRRHRAKHAAKTTLALHHHRKQATKTASTRHHPRQHVVKTASAHRHKKHHSKTAKAHRARSRDRSA